MQINVRLDQGFTDQFYELSKKYGTDKSGSFVNGVLAKIVKDID